MIFLAIDTGTATGSVALFEGDRLLALQECHLDKAHARTLMPMIDAVLAIAGVDKRALEAIAVTEGPGSYTGLRIGVSTAKGLCMALNKPLVVVSSLAVLANRVQPWAAQLNAWICPMIDARRMEVYCQLFDAKLNPQSGIHALVIDHGSFAAELEARPLIFAGDGAPKCRPIFAGQENAIVLDNTYTSAADMGNLVWQKIQQNDFADLVAFEPFYLKPFVATKQKSPWAV